MGLGELGEEFFRHAQVRIGGRIVREATATISTLGRPPKDQRKEPVSIRLSPEVLAWFRGSGPGWQTRIDAVLRAHMDEKAAAQR